MSRREFIADSVARFDRLRHTHSRGDRLRSLSINTLSLKAGPNEISGRLPSTPMSVEDAARLPPPLGPLGPSGRWMRR
jgi:hypothetical protein